jgi:hypothetical protein
VEKHPGRTNSEKMDAICTEPERHALFRSKSKRLRYTGTGAGLRCWEIEESGILYRCSLLQFGLNTHHSPYSAYYGDYCYCRYYCHVSGGQPRYTCASILLRNVLLGFSTTLSHIIERNKYDLCLRAVIAKRCRKYDRYSPPNEWIMACEADSVTI